MTSPTTLRPCFSFLSFCVSFDTELASRRDTNKGRAEFGRGEDSTWIAKSMADEVALPERRRSSGELAVERTTGGRGRPTLMLENRTADRYIRCLCQTRITSWSGPLTHTSFVVTTSDWPLTTRSSAERSVVDFLWPWIVGKEEREREREREMAYGVGSIARQTPGRTAGGGVRCGRRGRRGGRRRVVDAAFALAEAGGGGRRRLRRRQRVVAGREAARLAAGRRRTPRLRLAVVRHLHFDELAVLQKKKTKKNKNFNAHHQSTSTATSQTVSRAWRDPFFFLEIHRRSQNHSNNNNVKTMSKTLARPF